MADLLKIGQTPQSKTVNTSRVKICKVPTDINNLLQEEKIQKAGATYVTENYKMESGNSLINIKSLKWDTLEERRLRAKLTVFQKGRLGILTLELFIILLCGVWPILNKFAVL